MHARRPGVPPSLPPLRYLGAADVRAAMPPLPERLELAELTMRALGGDAELPPKIGVHPRQAGSLGHAMPALLRGADPAGADDLLGEKWIVGFPGNPDLGLPAYHGLVMLNDPQTGVPLAIVEAGTITAARTAAVSAVAIRQFGPGTAPRAPGTQPPRTALLGAGVQARGHLPVLGHLLPGVHLAVYDAIPERADSLADAARTTPGIGDATASPSAREAVAGADVVVCVASFGPTHQIMALDWLGDAALVVAVDYDTYAPAELARSAGLFAVDDRGQFLATRDAGSGWFTGYPEPGCTIGEALAAGSARAPGRILVSHLGVGLADVVFASAILRRAEQLGLGLLLQR